jgi:hypothetical protein
MQLVVLVLSATILVAMSRTVFADCEQICYPGLPCQVTEVSGARTLTEDLCAGDLVLMDGARLILPSGVGHLISAERSFKIVGSAEIVAQTCLARTRILPKAKTPETVNEFDRGPGSNGRGDAIGGRDGPDGGNGESGKNGAKGEDASSVRLVFADFSGGSLRICANGGNGSPGQEGGDGADGADGEQGGRAIPGQPFGCASGPGHGGNGGKGGDAGAGGNGGNGGDGGVVTFEVPGAFEEKLRDILSNRIDVDVSGGQPGAGGKAGSPGRGGHFGYGGRGATGCDGRETERKGHDGADGGPAAPGLVPTAGKAGKVVVKADR